MAFIARVGAPGFPQAGHTIRVRLTGTETLATGLLDLDGEALANPITVPGSEFWGFEPPLAAGAVDVYWDEGARNLVAKAWLQRPSFKMFVAMALEDVPRYLFLVVGDTAEDVAVSAAGLENAGVPEANIYWLVTETGGANTLTVQGLASASELGSITLSLAGGTLAVQGLESASALDSVALLLAGGTLAVQGLESASSLDSVTLSNPEDLVLTVQGLESATTLDGVTLVLASGVLSVGGLESASELANVTLVLAGGTLAVQGLESASELGSVVLEEQGGEGPLVVSDGFNEGIEGLYWQKAGGATYLPTGSGGKAQSNISGRSAAARRETFGNDQFSKATIYGANLSTLVNHHGVAVRMSVAANTMYKAVFRTYSGEEESEVFLELSKMVNGTQTVLGSYFVGYEDQAITTIAEIEAIGSAIKVYTGAARTQRISVTDSAIASGIPGFVFDELAAGDNQTIDDWSGGEV